MKPVIIVEGKNDLLKIKSLLQDDDIDILCTFGTPGTHRIESLKARIGVRPVFIFTDNDRSGAKIRAILNDAFPDAEQIYTLRGYAGVEGSPNEYLLERLEKAGLIQSSND